MKPVFGSRYIDTIKTYKIAKFIEKFGNVP